MKFFFIFFPQFFFSDCLSIFLIILLLLVLLLSLRLIALSIHFFISFTYEHVHKFQWE